ncbi:MAG: hypothetical protein AM324_004835 [Candidatus Thorarchaeota archaeon SMTZ1-83]|nr:MAG: hypothetical protein AM324_05955 [Candidatus Thorarchaeota archaeon SMTZ1-83]
MTDAESAGEDVEMELVGGTSATKQYAIGVILAAVYGVSALIPISAFLGSAGPLAQLTLTICIAPLFGILLGPTRGFIFGFIGGVITAFLPGVALFVPTVILGPAVSGLLSGLCLKSHTTLRSIRIPGPLLTALYLSIIMILYLVPNYGAWWFMVYYALAALVAVSLQFEEFRFDAGKRGYRRFLQLIPLALIGTITDFSMMTMGAVYILMIPAEVFGFGIFPFMLAERGAATIISAIVATVVLSTFKDVFPSSR